MKRLIVVILAILSLQLVGCSVPFFGRSAGKPSVNIEKDDMITLQENTQKEAAGGTAGNPPGGLAESGQADTGKTAETPLAGTAPSVEPDVAEGGKPDIMAGETIGQSGMTAGGILGENGSGFGKNLESQGNAEVHEKSEKPGGLTDYGTDSQDAGYGTDSSIYFAEPRRPVTVYYQDADGCIIPLTRWIRPQTGIARATLNLAIDGTIAREEMSYYGVYPVIPAGTEILGIDLKDGIATVDFSRHLLNYGSAVAERNIVTSIVYTLTEFETIDKVRILVNGYTQGVLKYGTDLTEPLGREDIMVNTFPHMVRTGVEKIDVFLLKPVNNVFTFPVPYSVAVSHGAQNLPELLVKNLLDARDEGGMFNEIPEGVRLLGCNVANGIVTLNFSGEFVDYGGTEKEEGILKQLAYTLRQCDGIRRIKILVDGRPAELPEGTDISGGLAIPATINDVMDR